MLVLDAMICKGLKALFNLIWTMDSKLMHKKFFKLISRSYGWIYQKKIRLRFIKLKAIKDIF